VATYGGRDGASTEIVYGYPSEESAKEAAKRIELQVQAKTAIFPYFAAEMTKPAAILEKEIARAIRAARKQGLKLVRIRKGDFTIELPLDDVVETRLDDDKGQPSPDPNREPFSLWGNDPPTHVQDEIRRVVAREFGDWRSKSWKSLADRLAARGYTDESKRPFGWRELKRILDVPAASAEQEIKLRW